MLAMPKDIVPQCLDLLSISLPKGSLLMSKLSGVRQSKMYKCQLALTGVKGLILRLKTSFEEFPKFPIFTSTGINMSRQHLQRF